VRRLETIELFMKLLSYPSVTPEDCGALSYIRDYLDDFEAEWINRVNVKNIFLHKRFGDGPHLCFAGHIDVVPPGEGWSSDPFVPRYEDGYIYARGAQDMKSGVAAFVQACRDVESFNGTLSLLITSDEEGEAKHGTVEVLRYLEEKNFLPDYAVVAEPTCEELFGDAVKIGRRGSINGVIEKIGKQGHAAYPLLTLTQSAKPFMTDKDSKIVKAISGAIEEVTGVKTSYSTAGGTSDARFFAEFGVDVVEFGVYRRRRRVICLNFANLQESGRKPRLFYANCVKSS